MKDSMRKFFDSFVEEHGDAMRRLAEVEREELRRFQLGLDSKYGIPEEGEDAND